MAMLDHWAWRRHFNGSGTEIAAIIRIQNFDSLSVRMRDLMDRTPLFEEPRKLNAPNQGEMKWPPPDAGRPA